MRIFFVLSIADLVLAGCAGGPNAADTSREKTPVGEASAWVCPDWEYPIAAGVWYPGDGPLPEHPFEYYRVRC